MPETVALIVAAGRGVRAGGDLPKQYRTIGGKSILRRSIDAFLSHPAIDRVVVAIAPATLATLMLRRKTTNACCPRLRAGKHDRKLSAPA